jgi:hypothetical protein
MKKVNAAPAATGFVAFISRNSDYKKNSNKMKPAYQFPQSPDHTTHGNYPAENQKKLNHMKKLHLPFKTLAITVLFILIVSLAQAITKMAAEFALSTVGVTSGNWNLSGARVSGDDILTGNGNLFIDGSIAAVKQGVCGITCPASITAGRNLTATDASAAGYRQFTYCQNSINPAILTR